MEIFRECPKCGSEMGGVVRVDNVENFIDEVWICECGCRYVASYKLIECEPLDD